MPDVMSGFCDFGIPKCVNIMSLACWLKKDLWLC